MRQISSIFIKYRQKKISNFLIFRIRQKTSNNVKKCRVKSKAPKNVITGASSQLTSTKTKNDAWRQSDVRYFASITLNWHHLTSIYAWRFQHYKKCFEIKKCFQNSNFVELEAGIAEEIEKHMNQKVIISVSELNETNDLGPLFFFKKLH